MEITLAKSENPVRSTHQFFVCASVVSYMAFVLPLFVLHLSFFW